MAVDPRIKGQEVECTFLTNGQIMANSIAIQSNNLKIMMEILTEGFLGETTNRKDFVFNGIGGEVSLQFSGPEVFNMINGFIDVARRRVASGTQTNVKHVYKFSSGRRGLVVLPDVSPGEITIDTSGRVDYVKVSFPYEVGSGSITII